MIITVQEIIEIVIMALAVGYIFSGFFKKRYISDDPFVQYSKPSMIDNLIYGIKIAAPAVILHELSHKFVAMAFGAQAVIHAPIGMYTIVILMRLLNFPIIFFVGGYVSIFGKLFAWQHALISLAGPLTNLIIYLVLISLVKFNLVNKKHYEMIGRAAKLNLFLFAFNMIPLPGFDGYSFFSAILSYIF
ncbi:hypothetical protein HN789_07655 [archaeon]|jgi:Zn-dependent protease|nr:hypothetical protein [archaeon]MBT4022858.1 hypothetical protein [archaeon]MBT4272948.1 hypothetical protein [archaeon]MBT4460961.1 hypothetical protein [archaeon]MBT4858012.1 hypothetical protein [archaeon]